jgi:hypothetical protein
MKKLLILIPLLPTFLTACDGQPDASSFPLQKPSYEYEIDTWGANSEVYEITPKSSPNHRCVMLMLDSGNAVGFDCFEVK